MFFFYWRRSDERWRCRCDWLSVLADGRPLSFKLCRTEKNLFFFSFSLPMRTSSSTTKPTNNNKNNIKADIVYKYVGDGSETRQNNQQIEQVSRPYTDDRQITFVILLASALCRRPNAVCNAEFSRSAECQVFGVTFVFLFVLFFILCVFAVRTYRKTPHFFVLFYTFRCDVLTVDSHFGAIKVIKIYFFIIFLLFPLFFCLSFSSLLCYLFILLRKMSFNFVAVFHSFDSKELWVQWFWEWISLYLDACAYFASICVIIRSF